MFEQINRNVMIQMIEWYIGTKTNFEKSSGKLGKHFQYYLNDTEWKDWLETFSDADIENIWTSLFKMSDLFRRIATYVAKELHFNYPKEDDQNVMAYLKKVRQMPKDAARLLVMIWRK